MFPDALNSPVHACPTDKCECHGLSRVTDCLNAIDCYAEVFVRFKIPKRENKQQTCKKPNILTYEPK